jgi:hypothetical protein
MACNCRVHRYGIHSSDFLSNRLEVPHLHTAHDGVLDQEYIALQKGMHRANLQGTQPGAPLLRLHAPPATSCQTPCTTVAKGATTSVIAETLLDWVYLRTPDGCCGDLRLSQQPSLFSWL